MKIQHINQLPDSLQDFYRTVKQLKANEARKQASKLQALNDLRNMLNGDKSVLIVTNKHLAVCDINPQTKVSFNREDTSPEIQAIMLAEAALRQAQEAYAATIANGKAAGKITVSSSDSIRMEILSQDKAL